MSTFHHRIELTEEQEVRIVIEQERPTATEQAKFGSYSVGKFSLDEARMLLTIFLESINRGAQIDSVLRNGDPL